jgi:hypothetical protein
VYGATKYSHLLSNFLLDRLVLQETAYQMVIHGVSVTLYRIKIIFAPLSLFGSLPIHSRMSRIPR